MFDAQVLTWHLPRAEMKHLRGQGDGFLPARR